MSGQRHLSDDERARMEEELERHYGEPVRPVSEVFEAFAAFATALRENDSDGPYADAPEVGYAVREHGAAAMQHAKDSNLLRRLLHRREALRTVKCPVHEGRWSADKDCPYGCGGTGWLKSA